MLKRFVIFAALVALLLFALRFERHVFFLVLFGSFTLIPVYHSIFQREWFVSILSIALVFLLFLFHEIRAFSWVWLGWGISYAGFVGFAVFFELIWKADTRSVEEEKGLSDGGIRKLQSMHDIEKLRCHDLDAQLNDIIGLYELAKDLNYCMSFEELIQALRKRILEDISFRRLRIIIREGDGVSSVYEIDSERESAVSVGPGDFKWETAILRRLERTPVVLRLGESIGTNDIELNSEKLSSPAWFFPLVVEGKLIAAFIVEGANLKDFHKFEIVSAQLALQVKKINLYFKVRELSIVDGLTLVFVRRHFLERFEEELKRSIRHGFQLTCLMLDIDHFKTYNDSFGHLVGDVTLRAVAEIIHANVRQVDIVCRYGGEEFAIVLPEAGLEEGLEVAERIRSSIAKKHFKLYDEETKVTASIGVSNFPADLNASGTFNKELILELLRRADHALYQAKEEGRNRVVAYK
ncbi:MAG: sensor domain-containing diguanylate cyclase [Candidatus Omnitrophica bacterium]|nr:sensor domain-containing diguanylate cyclase [Candidatus Omnitrophota bacterium]